MKAAWLHVNSTETVLVVAAWVMMIRDLLPSETGANRLTCITLSGGQHVYVTEDKFAVLNALGFVS